MWPHLINIVHAFNALTTCRPVDQGVPRRIPWTAIHDYAETHAVGDRDRFEQLIRQMDDAWLESSQPNESRTTDDVREGRA